MDFHYYFVDKDGYYAGEHQSTGDDATIAKFRAEVEAKGLTIIDAKADGAVRPADRPAVIDPLKTAYAKATTVEEKLDVIAERQGLK